MAILDLVEFLENGHGNDDTVLFESGNCCGVVQQDIGVQYISLLDDGFQIRGFFYTQGGA